MARGSVDGMVGPAHPGGTIFDQTRRTIIMMNFVLRNQLVRIDNSRIDFPRFHIETLIQNFPSLRKPLSTEVTNGFEEFAPSVSDESPGRAPRLKYSLD
jgi:hypothetical protein